MLRLKYVNEYRDRNGKLRRYFRRGATRGPLPGEVGSAEFMTAYQAFLGHAPAPTAKAADSLGLLITEYYASRAFRNLKQSSRQTYRAALEPIAKLHGHRTARISHRQAAKLIGDLGEKRPAMANLTRRVLAQVYRYALKSEWQIDTNPFLGVDTFKTGTHHTWTEGELQAFEQQWAVGTRQRLAYALLLYTMQRVGDVAKMRRADVVGDEIRVIQQKTGTELVLPLTVEVQQALRAWPARGLTLIGREDGRQMTRAGLTAFMARAIEEAGLSAKCVSHGLRKAGMRRMAELGYTVHQIAAWSGHKSLREVERYTKAADQRRLARDAVRNRS